MQSKSCTIAKERGRTGVVDMPPKQGPVVLRRPASRRGVLKKPSKKKKEDSSEEAPEGRLLLSELDLKKIKQLGHICLEDARYMADWFTCVAE